MTRIPVDAIKVWYTRRPVTPSAVKSLAASIEEVGLLNPITVRPDGKSYVLVAGLHRLEAVRSLDWLEIDAVVVNLDELGAELAEIDENLIRNDLTVLERGEQLARRKAVYERMYPEAKTEGPGRPKKSDTVSVFSEDVSTKTGESQRSIQRHVQIATAIPDDVREAIRETPVADSTRELLTLARQEPETQREVANRITSGNAPTVQQALTDIRRENRIERMVPPEPTEALDRVYPVIYADPPWRYDFSKDSADEIEEHYPTMEAAEIAFLSIPAAENAVLFLWATAPKLQEALFVLNTWGFTYKTNIVWDKQRIGMGYWARGRHEILLIGTRGDVPPPTFKPESVLCEKRTEHSRKPQTMRQWIEKMFPDMPRVELFARERVEGWDCWGNDI